MSTVRAVQVAVNEIPIEALPAVPYDSPAWDDPTEWRLPDEEMEAIDRANGYDLREEPEEVPGAPSAEEQAEIDRQTDLADGPPPVSGGSPDPLDEVRRWYRERESFGDWLESEGGIAWEEGRPNDQC